MNLSIVIEIIVLKFRLWVNSTPGIRGYGKILESSIDYHSYIASGYTLIGPLAIAGLDFVFKGGTSLILLMQAPGRFSIDIDIVTMAERAEIEGVLKQICTGNPFKDYKLNNERSYKPGIPKAHYSLVYNSNLTDKEDHILLDILMDEHSYPFLSELPVVTEWLKTDGLGVPVKVPTHESITGDKLTAILSSSKAALMAAKIKTNATGPVDIFTPESPKQDYLI